MKTLSLVIPVYNAPDLARTACEHMSELASNASGCGFELLETIFVDDGSVQPLELSLPEETPVPIRVLRQPANRGKGAAVRAGALAAKGDWVLMSDVDLSAPLTEFANLAPHADAWMVCGSRYGRDGMPLRRRILSRLFHVLVDDGFCLAGALFGLVRDNGCSGWRRCDRSSRRSESSGSRST